MSDNVLKTLQQLVQDVIAPDVREQKVRLESMDKRTDLRFEQVDKRFDMLEQKMDTQFQAIMAAIRESRAQVELNNVRLIAALSERVAVLEAQRP